MSIVSSNNYLESLLQGQPHLPPSPLAWFNLLRATAVERAGVLKLPTTRDEEWRFTDISPLGKLSFQPARAASSAADADIERFFLKEAAVRLVFIDGIYAPKFSTWNGRENLIVTHLSNAVSVHAKTMEAHLSRHADFQDNLFAALNTAFLHDGAVVIVPRNATVEMPVHILFIATQPASATSSR